jgi:hypothetical protein
VKKHILSISDKLVQSSYFVTIQIDEVIFAEGRPDKQSVQRTSQDHLAGSSGQMKSRSRKRVYVHMKK